MSRVDAAIPNVEAQARVDKLASLLPNFGDAGNEELRQSQELLADAARSLNQLPKHIIQDLNWSEKVLDSLIVWGKGAPATASCNALLILKFAMKNRSVGEKYMTMALHSVVYSTALVDGIITDSSLADGHTSSENMSKLLSGSLILVRSIELIESMAERDDVPAIEAKDATSHVFSILNTTSAWRQSSSEKGTSPQQQVQKFVSKLEVHLCKYISLLMEIWKNETGTETSIFLVEGDFVSTLLTSLDAIQHIVMVSDIVHDAFLSAFGLIVEVIGLRKRGDSDSKIEEGLIKVLDECHRWIKSRVGIVEEGLSEEMSLVEVRRLENVLSLVEYVFNPGALTGPALSASLSAEYKYARRGDGERGPVDLAILTVVEAQGILRALSKVGGTSAPEAALTAADSTMAMSAEKRAELRKMCSDCRRTSIEAAVVALESRAFLAQSGASWVYDNYQDPEGEFWVLSLRHLSSPLLFPPAYRAYLTFEGEVASTRESDGKDILMFEVRRALSTLHKYSVNAAADVLDAVDSLLDLGCCDLLVSSDEDEDEDEDEDTRQRDIFSLLLGAYDARPRGCKQETLWKHHERALYCLGKAFALFQAPPKGRRHVPQMTSVLGALSLPAIPQNGEIAAETDGSELALSPLSRVLQRLTDDILALFSEYKVVAGGAKAGDGRKRGGGEHGRSRFGASLRNAEALFALLQACSSALMTALNVTFSLPLSPSEQSHVADASASGGSTAADPISVTVSIAVPPSTTDAAVNTPGLGDNLARLMTLLRSVAATAGAGAVFEDEHRLRLMLPDLTAKVTIAACVCSRRLRELGNPAGSSLLDKKEGETVTMGVDIICQHAFLGSSSGTGVDISYPFGREALLYLGEWLHSENASTPKGDQDLQGLYSRLPVDAPTPLPSEMTTEVISLFEKLLI